MTFHDHMQRNPLTTIAIVVAIGDCYSLYEAVINGSVDLFRILVWLQGIAFLYLYLTRSAYAGSFLFYSALPIYPLYFGLMAVGWAPIASPTVLGIMLAIYVAAAVSIWRVKREYERYYTTQMAPKGEATSVNAPSE
jgi:hypothetical protein